VINMNKHELNLKENKQTILEKSKLLISVADKILARKIKPIISDDKDRTIEYKDGILAWLDKETGLMWEVKTKENVNIKYTWDDCMDNYPNILNKQNYAGFNDWRIPSTKELETIINRKEMHQLYIKKPLTKTSESFYWSLNVHNSYAFYINFSNNQYELCDKINQCYVRCVRGFNTKWIKVLIDWAYKNNLLLMEKKGFTGRPEKILEVTILNLENCHITELPEEIGNLINLKQLLFYGNNLKKLPITIGNLINLTHLFLGKNSLSKLPKEIGKLKNLIYLNLENNNLNEVPKKIGNLTNLQQLFLNDNNLKKLPKEITNLTNLQKLDIHNNNFTYLPRQDKSFINSIRNTLNTFKNTREENNIINWLNKLKKDGCEITITKE